MSPSKDSRNDAIVRIKHIAENHLTPEQGLFALEFALSEPGPQDEEKTNFQELYIVEAVAKSPHKEYIPFIQERLDRF